MNYNEWILYLTHPTITRLTQPGAKQITSYQVSPKSSFVTETINPRSYCWKSASHGLSYFMGKSCLDISIHEDISAEISKSLMAAHSGFVASYLNC